MKNKIMHLILALAIMILAIAGSTGIVLAGDYTATTMRLLDYEGTVEIERPEGTSPADMKNIRMESGEAIITGDGSRASIGLDDSKVITLDENSRAEFTKGSGKLELTLTKGQLLFDVQEKLKENESFDIKTSTMVIGIRGTIGVVSVMPVNAVTTQNTAVTSQTKEITSVMIFEGGTEVTLNDGTDSNIELYVPAAQMLVVPDNIKEAGVRPSCVTIKKENINAFTIGEIKKNNNLRDRAEKYVGEILIPLIEESTEGDAPTSDDDQKNDPQLQDAVNNGYPADTEWEYRKRVDLIAQSASKLYDGTPLTRPGDILVEGLPEGLSIDVSADGSRTDAGVSSNPISKYTIYNKLGEDITSHFKNVVITEGSLVVDPAPLVVWTGSASKVYDGTPLTNPNAGIRSYPGHEENQPLWRNMSYIVGNSVESTQAQVLYGICGTIWVHGTNPLTTDTIEKELKAGEKLTVYLSDEGGEESIRYEISSVGVNELPDEVIRIYANNPEMMKQACSDAGWSRELMEKRIQDLLNSEDGIYASKETVEHDGLTVNAEDTDSLMRDCTNVRINIDTSITDYNDRALSRQESYYTPVQIDENIKVTAVGSRTYVGYNKNYYTIDWGNANRDNYILYEELGTLRVYAKEKEDPADPDNPDDPDVPDDPTYDDEIVITASSASKTYNGKPLTSASVTVSGLPSGFRLEAAASGSQTDAGTGTNRILSFKIYDSNGKDVTSLCTNVNLETGNLTVRPAALTITTNSDEKIYNGTSLTAAGVKLDGLAQADKKKVTAVATGSITDAGSVKNSYSIDWGNANKDNYTISDKLGTLYVTPASLTIVTDSGEKEYDGTPLTAAGVEISGLTDADSGKVTVTATGSITDAGSADNSCSINWSDVNKQNYTITENLGTLKVTPVKLYFDLAMESEYDMVYEGDPYIPEYIQGYYDYENESEIECAEFYIDEQEIPEYSMGTYNLLGSDQLKITVNGVTDAGEYTIEPDVDFISGKAQNYEIHYIRNKFTIQPLGLEIRLGYYGESKIYTGTFIPPNESSYTVYVDSYEDVLYRNSFEINEDDSPATAVGIFSLPGDGQLKVSIDLPVDEGEYTLTPTLNFINSKSSNFDCTYTDNTLTILSVTPEEDIITEKPLSISKLTLPMGFRALRNSNNSESTVDVTKKTDVTSNTDSEGNIDQDNDVKEEPGNDQDNDVKEETGSDQENVNRQEVINDQVDISTTGGEETEDQISVPDTENNEDRDIVKEEDTEDPETVYESKETEDPESVIDVESTENSVNTIAEEKEEENIPEEDKDDEDNTQEAIVTEPVSTGEPDEDN